MYNALIGAGLKKKALLSLLISLALAGCGGGGGGENTPKAEPTTPSPPIVVVFPPVAVPLTSDVVPSCVNCGVAGPTAYSGSGVGVWHKTNTGSVEEDVKVAISGLVNKDVTLIFTNETSADIVMPSIVMQSGMAPRASLSSLSGTTEANPTGKAAIDEFNRKGWAKLVSTPKTKVASSFGRAGVAAPQQAIVDATRTFNYHDGSSRSTTLKKQVTLSDGVVANFWVQTTEATAARVSTALLDEMAAAFAGTGGIYDRLTDTGGAVWGPHGYAELLPDTRTIDIVLMNLTPNAQAFGELGYFHAVNNFTKAYAPESNESVSVYLDTETLYLGGIEGKQTIKMTLAHEGMHMSNFYRRGVIMGPEFQFDTWLEEMTAMMMEDAAGDAIDPTYNPTRDMRFPSYLNYASYNCPLLNFTGFAATCESYSVSGSFGGFLLRQLGMPFYKNLLNRVNMDSEGALNAAIQAYRPQSGLGAELRKFAVAAIPAPSAGTAPAEFNFPARNDSGYSIPAINAQSYKAYRVLPTSVPTHLKAYASFPVVRKAVSGTFQETVRVPAGATLSVVVN